MIFSSWTHISWFLSNTSILVIYTAERVRFYGFSYITWHILHKYLKNLCKIVNLERMTAQQQTQNKQRTVYYDSDQVVTYFYNAYSSVACFTKLHPKSPNDHESITRIESWRTASSQTAQKARTLVTGTPCVDVKKNKGCSTVVCG